MAEDLNTTLHIAEEAENSVSQASGDSGRQLPNESHNESHSTPGAAHSAATSPRKDRRNSTPESSEIIGERRITELVEDILRKIFSYLFEKDLRRVAQVCKYFNSIADDLELWRRLYKDRYEYDLPLMFGHDPYNVYFLEMYPEASDQQQDSTVKGTQESADVFPGMRMEHSSESSSTSPSDKMSSVRNPWKESFRLLYRAVHVHRDHKKMSKKAKENGRTIKYYGKIAKAVEWSQRKRVHSRTAPIILIHAGTYDGEWFNVTLEVIILGCGPTRNPAQTVILQNPRGTECISFTDQHGQSYLGYVTLYNYCTDEDEFEGRPLTDISYCVLMLDRASPILDHCIVRSPDGNGILVSKRCDPIVGNCDISYIGNSAITLSLFTRGLYEDNRIERCYRAFDLDEDARPSTQNNIIRDCCIVGIEN